MMINITISPMRNEDTEAPTESCVPVTRYSNGTEIDKQSEDTGAEDSERSGFWQTTECCKYVGVETQLAFHVSKEKFQVKEKHAFQGGERKVRSSGNQDVETSVDGQRKREMCRRPIKIKKETKWLRPKAACSISFQMVESWTCEG